MKIKKPLCLVFALILALSAFHVFAFADNSQTCTHPNVDVTFTSPVSAETAERVRALLCEDCEETESQTRGLMCDLFGHKLQTGNSIETAHQARATAPRCLQNTYYYEICSRCDYNTLTLTNSIYINCCS